MRPLNFFFLRMTIKFFFLENGFQIVDKGLQKFFGWRMAINFFSWRRAWPSYFFPVEGPSNFFPWRWPFNFFLWRRVLTFLFPPYPQLINGRPLTINEVPHHTKRQHLELFPTLQSE